jgi:hypothetical protein
MLEKQAGALCRPAAAVNIASGMAGSQGIR